MVECMLELVKCWFVISSMPPNPWVKGPPLTTMVG